MKRSINLLIILGSILFVIIIAGITLFYHKKQGNSPQSTKPVLSYYVTPSLPSHTLIEESISKELAAEYSLDKLEKPELADIILTNLEIPGSVGVGDKSIAKPAPLKSDTFIVSERAPVAYLAVRNQAQAISQARKDKLITTIEATLPKPTTWSLNAVADIIIGRTVYEQEAKRKDYTSSFHKVAEILKSADVTLANNESTLADGIPYPLTGLSFAAPKQAIDGFVYSGIDAVNLANNHAYNGGPTAFSQMIDNFNNRGIKTFGGGKNLTESRTPATLNVKGLKLGLLGYNSIPGSGTATNGTPGQPFIAMPPWGVLDEAQITQMEEEIKSAKQNHDVVIVYFHWGQEYVHTASEQTRSLAHRAIDAGANLILGSHPHWVQGIEWYKDSLITYSLGNFVFDQEQMLKTKQGTILSINFEDNRLVGAKFTPVLIENYFQPRPLGGEEANLVLHDIYSHSWWPN